MYLRHFGLTRQPFQIKPDDDFLYMSSQHSRALVFMDYAAWNPEGFVIISGEIGSGKTTLVKRMLRNYQGKINHFHISYTNLASEELFYFMIRQANISINDHNKVTMLYALNDFLKEKTKNGNPFVLVIDEAQNLTHENLEDIRLLAGLEGMNGPMLKVVLLGQPELQQHVNEVPQLRQRVKLHYHLNALGEEETKGYIEYRLKVAGMPQNSLFDDDLMDVIYEHSQGIPRLINKICDALLMCAFAEDKQRPNAEDLEGVLNELMMGDDSATPALPAGEEPAAALPAPEASPAEDADSDDEDRSADESQSAAAGSVSNEDFRMLVSYMGRIADSLEGLERKLDRLIPEKDRNTH